MLWRWAAAALWLAFAAFLSRQSGAQTAGLSWKIASVPIDWLKGIGVDVDAQAFHLFLRKATHIGIFMVTGVLLYHAIGASFARQKACRAPVPVVCAVFMCAAISTLDEYQKYWIDGRHCQWDEALLNFIGSAVGILLARAATRRRV